MSYIEILNEVGIKVPNIYMPSDRVDLSKYAVIAADQFSAEKRYWEKVKSYVGDSVSTLNMFLPEAYMPLTIKKTKEIHKCMKDYVSNKDLVEIGECFIYVKRETTVGVRHGLIVAVDLEQYDYSKKAKSLIRPTEGTVEDRLPVRIQLREGALLDIPHVLMLINDKENILMSSVDEMCKDKKPLYDFDLMFGAGNIKGYKINDECDYQIIGEKLNILKENSLDNLLYAIGDGNHSLAAAKICYENNKKPENRYALVELVNIYDEGVAFYPINRLIMNVNKSEFFKEIDIDIKNPPPLQDLQPRLDKYLKTHKETKLEYIHGAEECMKLGSIEGNIPIIYETFEKNNFFNDIVEHGSLCRKSFSIGKNIDKRYYLESMKIK